MYLVLRRICAGRCFRWLLLVVVVVIINYSVSPAVLRKMKGERKKSSFELSITIEIRFHWSLPKIISALTACSVYNDRQSCPKFSIRWCTRIYFQCYRLSKSGTRFSTPFFFLLLLLLFTRVFTAFQFSKKQTNLSAGIYDPTAGNEH